MLRQNIVQPLRGVVLAVLAAAARAAGPPSAFQVDCEASGGKLGRAGARVSVGSN